MIPWGPKVETGYRPEPQLFRMKHDADEQTDLAKCHPRRTHRLMQLLESIKAYP